MLKIPASFEEEYLNNADYYFIEWPEKLADLIIPYKACEVVLKIIDENTRAIEIYV
jgi:tRNA A37 threonylcarbamoyladenosine biosynthesis protein TsaE